MSAEKLDPREREALLEQAKQEYQAKYHRISEEAAAQGYSDKTPQEILAYLTDLDPEFASLLNDPEFSDFAENVCLEAAYEIGDDFVWRSSPEQSALGDNGPMHHRPEYEPIQGSVFSQDMMSSLRVSALVRRKGGDSDPVASIRTAVAQKIALDYAGKNATIPGSIAEFLDSEGELETSMQDSSMRALNNFSPENLGPKLKAELDAVARPEAENKRLLIDINEVRQLDNNLSHFGGAYSLTNFLLNSPEGKIGV